MMLFVMIDRMLVLWLLPIMGVFTLVMFIALREQTIKILRKYAGKKIAVAPIDQEEDMGEVMEFRIKNIYPLEEFTEEERRLKSEISEKEKEMISSFERTKDLKFIKVDPKAIENKKMVKQIAEHNRESE